MAGKWVELKAIAPNVTRVSIVFNPTTAAGAGAYFLTPFESAARAIGLEPRTVAVKDPSELDRAIASLGAERTSALIVMPDSFNVVHRDRIIAATAQHGLPAVYPYRYMAAAGGLMSYGVDLRTCMCVAQSRSTASFEAPIRVKCPYRYPPSLSS